MKTRICIGFTALSALTFCATARAADPSPNFVLLFADDLGYGDLGCYGHPTIRTPRLDRMAAEGMRFTQFYSAASVCSPSRAALMTGRLPVRSGVLGVLFPQSAGGLPDSEVTIAQALKQKGYATACIGKWHLGHLPRYLPTRRGFDSYFGIPYSNDMGRWTARGTVPLMRDEEVAEDPAVQETLTPRYTDEAIAFIRRNRDRPFFLYLPYTYPHVPLHASDAARGKSSRGLYGDVVEEIDTSVGRILDCLTEQGVAGRTLVFFSSDNGPWLSQKADGGSAGLLRDGKGTTWEGGMREPGIAWWPGQIRRGAVVTDLAGTLDILPTFLKLAGVDPPADRPLDGYDISRVLLSAGPSPRKEMFFYQNKNLCAFRKGRYKIHLVTTETGAKRGAVKHDPPLLYDLDHDPSEKCDIAAEHPDVVADLLKEVEKHRANLVPAPSQMDARIETQPAGQSSTSLPALLRTPPGVKRIADIEYARVDGQPLLLDIYLPEKGPRPLPVIVWIHGGAWVSGSKEPCSIVSFSGKGYAVVSMNYRLTGTARFPAQINDCKAVVRWVRAHAGEYGFDPDRVGAAGGSAGGHLVALLGTSGGVKKLEGDVGGNLEYSSRVQAVCDFCGPTDFTTRNYVRDAEKNEPAILEKALVAFLGGPWEEKRETARLASPVSFITKDDPPFLIVHGDADNVIPVKHSRMLYDRLKDAGVEAALHVVPGGGHGVGGHPGVLDQAAAFFDAHLKKATSGPSQEQERRN